jgi:hypothetical protein
VQPERRFAAALALAVILPLAFAAAARPQALALAGSDRVRLQLPAAGLVESYQNAGYRLQVSGGVATVEVSLAPLRSRQPFSLPSSPAADPLAVLARGVATGSRTRYEAVTRVLVWVTRNVAYDLDRHESQNALAVLARRRGYCTGVARLTVALLKALDIPAREVPGFLVAPAAGAIPAGFHRWVEVRYDDVGWVFSDPLLALHYVPATYVRLASEALVPEPESAPGRLLDRQDQRLPIDLLTEAPARVTVRRNDGVRRSGALLVTVGGATAGRAVLEGSGIRRVRALDHGESTFVGLEPGSYLLRIEVEGAPARLKRVILRDRVWGSVHLPGLMPPTKEEST